MCSDNPSAERAASHLHALLANIEEFGERIPDHALSYRVSAMGEAIRICADAMEYDQRTLRKSGCEDLAIVALRLAENLRPESGPVCHVTEAEDILSGTVAAIGMSIFETGSRLTGTAALDVHTVIDGPVGNLSRKVMLEWSHAAHMAINALENRVLYNPDLRSPTLRMVVRDGWAASALLSAATAAMADCSLLDVTRIEGRLLEAKNVAVLSQALLTRIDELGEVDVLGTVIPASRAFAEVLRVVDAGCRLLKLSVEPSTDGLMVTLWRLLSKGRLCTDDGLAHSLIDMSAADGWSFPDVRFLDKPPVDLRTLSELGHVAESVRQEWAA